MAEAPTVRSIPLVQGKLRMPVMKDDMLPRERYAVHPQAPTICAYCTRPNATFYCDECGKAAYCSYSCQKSHWNFHVHTCHPLTKLVLNDPEIGRKLLIASKAIEPNSTVHRLTPVMVIPSPLAKPLNSNGFGYTHNHLCLGCCAWYTNKSKGHTPCPNCSWSTCSRSCAENSVHSEYECKIFRDRRVLPKDSKNMNILSGVLALRCLLLQTKNPDVFKRLMAVENEVKILKTRAVDSRNWDRKMINFLFEDCRLQSLQLPRAARSDVLLLLKIIDVCSLSMKECVSEIKPLGRKKDFSPRYFSARYVFPRKLEITHHCSPNMRWAIFYNPCIEKTHLTFIATREVQAGENITAAWSLHLELGTLARRNMHFPEFEDPCNCSRCVDPTEHGTELSTIHCSSCRKLTLRSTNPLNKNASWKCSCQKVPNLREIFTKLDQANINFEKTSKQIPSELIKLIQMNGKEPSLHSNHYLVVRGIFHLVRVIGSKIMNAKRPDEVGVQVCDDAISMIDRMLELQDKLVPGKTEMRGRLLYQKQAMMAYVCMRDAVDFLSLDDYKKSRIPLMIQGIRDIQKEAHDILQHSPPGTMSHYLSQRLELMWDAMYEIFSIRAPRKRLDDTLAAQLHNAYSIMTKIPHVNVPNGPLDFSIDDEEIGVVPMYCLSLRQTRF